MKPISLHGHEKSITQVCYNREGDLLFSCAKDKHPNVWYSINGERLGTYDGHGGASCGIVTANRLQHYVATGLMSKEDVSGHLDRLRKAGRFTIVYSLSYLL